MLEPRPATSNASQRRQPPSGPPGRRSPRFRFAARAGFSLVEVMVVVLVISMLAMIAVPTFAKIKRKAKTAALLNDFRVFAAAFESYAQETGDFPAESAAGVFPAGMDKRINKTQWLRTTPMGGQYDWESNQTHFGVKYRAAIAIKGTATAPLTLDINQLTDLEEALDGSNINWLGGTFHIGTGLVPLYVIQQ